MLVKSKYECISICFSQHLAKLAKYIRRIGPHAALFYVYKNTFP